MESFATTERVLQKSGYLLKNSSVGIYRKRFFEINGEYLTYYKTEKRRKLLEAISIPGAVNIRLIDGYSNPSHMMSPSDSKSILIDTRDRQYELMADTVDDAQLWFKELLAIREKVLITSHLEKSIRQNWTFTPSGKAIKRGHDGSLHEFREQGRYSERTSAAVTIDNDREDTNLTTEDVVVAPEKKIFGVLNSGGCCMCLLPLMSVFQ